VPYTLVDKRKVMVNFAKEKGLSSSQDAAVAADPKGVRRTPPQNFTPVVVLAANPWGGEKLRRRFSPKQGFLLIERDGDDILAQCRRMAPCVVLADVAFFERADAKDLATVFDFGRSVQALAFGQTADEQTIQKLLRLGCMGFVPESTSVTVLGKAVKAVTGGEMWVQRGVLTRFLRELLSWRKSPKLSSRESDVLRLIAQGYKNRAIAEQLSITHDTVRWHIRSLHAKLGVKDRLGTTLWAQRYLGELASEQTSPEEEALSRASSGS
jgi:DNA-binding NarL/FixJ family response regulator